MSPAEQTCLTVWYESAYNDLRRAVDLEDRRLVARDKAAGDLTIIDWPQEERDKFRAIAQGAWADFAASSELAKETYDSEVDYMKSAGLLKE